MANAWLYFILGLVSMTFAGVLLWILVRAFRSASETSRWKSEWTGTAVAVAMVALLMLLGAVTIHGGSQLTSEPMLGVFGAALASIVAFGIGARAFGRFPE